MLFGARGVDIHKSVKYLQDILNFKYCHVSFYDHVLVYENVNLKNMTFNKFLRPYEDISFYNDSLWRLLVVIVVTPRRSVLSFSTLNGAKSGCCYGARCSTRINLTFNPKVELITTKMRKKKVEILQQIVIMNVVKFIELN